MTVYRLETPKGEGPFRAWIVKPWDKECAGPGPEEDGIIDVEDDDVFGFQTKTKLKDWFGKSSIRRMAKQKCYITAYEVHKTKVVCGGHQCVFKKKDAYKSKRIPIHKVY